MAAEPLRVIAMAYFDMSISDWEATFESDMEANPDKLFEEHIV
jgi:hypothetical protein